MGETPQAWLSDPNVQAQESIMDGMTEASLTGDWVGRQAPRIWNEKATRLLTLCI